MPDTNHRIRSFAFEFPPSASASPSFKAKTPLIQVFLTTSQLCIPVALLFVFEFLVNFTKFVPHQLHWGSILRPSFLNAS